MSCTDRRSDDPSGDARSGRKQQRSAVFDCSRGALAFGPPLGNVAERCGHAGLPVRGANETLVECAFGAAHSAAQAGGPPAAHPRRPASLANPALALFWQTRGRVWMIKITTGPDWRESGPCRGLIEVKAHMPIRRTLKSASRILRCHGRIGTTSGVPTRRTAIAARHADAAASETLRSHRDRAAALVATCTAT